MLRWKKQRSYCLAKQLVVAVEGFGAAGLERGKGRGDAEDRAGRGGVTSRVLKQLLAGVVYTELGGEPLPDPSASSVDSETAKFEVFEPHEPKLSRSRAYWELSPLHTKNGTVW